MVSKKRPKFNLVCSDCRTIGYVTVKNPSNSQDKVELKKFCAKCRKHTIHQEKKLPNPKPRN